MNPIKEVNDPILFLNYNQIDKNIGSFKYH